MTQKMHVVNLEGGGDISLFLVTPEAFNWANEVSPDEVEVPTEVIESLRPFAIDLDQFVEMATSELTISTGSGDNDAFLRLSMMCPNFETISQLFEKVKEQDFTLLPEQFDGYIY